MCIYEVAFASIVSFMMLHACLLAFWALQEDDDVSAVLKGVSSASLEALNFADYLNQKYDAFTTWWDFYWIFVWFSWDIHGILMGFGRIFAGDVWTSLK